MVTYRQTECLRDLRVDPRVDLTDLSREEASDSIVELKELYGKAGLPP